MFWARVVAGAGLNVGAPCVACLCHATGQNHLAAGSPAWAPLPATSEDSSTAGKGTHGNTVFPSRAGPPSRLVSLLLPVGQWSCAMPGKFDTGTGEEMVSKEAYTITLFLKFCVGQARVHGDPFSACGLICKQEGPPVPDGELNSHGLPADVQSGFGDNCP